MDNDLISRAAIIREIERIRKSTKTLTGIDFLWMIETFPPVDAAPVVRCKNCWKLGYDNCPMDDYFDSHPKEPDFFCAAGEPEEMRPRSACGPDYCEIGGGDDE